MKSFPIETTTTLGDVLNAADEGQVVVLTSGGETRYALVPADEGDIEAFSLARNREFMAFLAEAELRAAKGPRKTLTAVRGMFSEDLVELNEQQTK